MIERKWKPENHKLGGAFFPVELCGGGGADPIGGIGVVE